MALAAGLLDMANLSQIWIPKDVPAANASAASMFRSADFYPPHAISVRDLVKDSGEDHTLGERGAGPGEGMHTPPHPFLPMHMHDDWNASDWDYLNLSAALSNLSGTEGGLLDDGDATELLVSAVLRGIALTIVVLMTIVGNVLVLLAVFVNAHLRSTTHYFIANLAVADLLLGTTVLPFSASLEVVDYWAFGQIFCDVWAAVDVLCCTASIMSLCVISIDRYIGVTRPLQHSSIVTERRAFIVILSVWLISVAISIAPLFGWKDTDDNDPTVCNVTTQLGYVLFSVSGSFYIPLAIILVVYFRVYREALKQSKFLKTGIKTSKSDEASHEVTLRIHTGGRGGHTTSPIQGPPGAGAGPGLIGRALPPHHSRPPLYQSSSSSEHSEESSRKAHTKLTLAGKLAKFNREKKAAKTLGIVVGVFILCWFPFFFVLPLEALCSTCRTPEWLFKIIFWLGYCNSMMNPIIYAMSSREFKRAFVRILRCHWRRQPRSFLGVPVNAYREPASGTSPTSSTGMAVLGRRLWPWTRPQGTKPLGGGPGGRSRGWGRGGRGRDRSRGGPKGGSVDSRSFLMCGTHNARRLDEDSPISSLRLLHTARRQRDHQPAADDVSDDDSAGHMVSGDDSDNEDIAQSAHVRNMTVAMDVHAEDEEEDEEEEEEAGVRTSLLGMDTFGEEPEHDSLKSRGRHGEYVQLHNMPTSPQHAPAPTPPTPPPPDPPQPAPTPAPVPAPAPRPCQPPDQAATKLTVNALVNLPDIVIDEVRAAAQNHVTDPRPEKTSSAMTSFTFVPDAAYQAADRDNIMWL